MDEVMGRETQSSFDFGVGDEGQEVIKALDPHRGPVALRQPDDKEISGGKGSIYYRAHSYHTKVPVEGLVRLLEHYTDPGDVVADPFCGSGMTGLAAVLTGRRAVISDLSPAAVHIARGYTARADPSLVAVAGKKVLEALTPVENALYGDSAGRIEYTIWSDVYACPDCEAEILFWESGVDHESGKLNVELRCPMEHGPYPKTVLQWLRSVPVQENLTPAAGRRRLVRKVNDATRILSFVAREDIPWWYPQTPWEVWREMWRGQHREMGIGTAADFFTPRNLYSLTALWHEIGQIDDTRIRDALRFVFTATVNRASRRYQWHPSRPTNVLSSTMYVASLNYEFNVFSLFRRKLSAIVELYQRTWLAPGVCEVRQGSATDLAWAPDQSVDYVFTDPPFGSNIFYADSSFLWEAWLSDATDIAAEAVVNKKLAPELGGKDLGGYEALMTTAMSEVARILRPNAWASLQFHNTDDKVWSSVQRAVEDAGFAVEAAVTMDKGQSSFKGLRHEGKGERVANFDLVLHLRRDLTTAPRRTKAVRESTREGVVVELLAHVANAPRSRCTTPWLHSVVMRWLIAQGARLDGWSFTAVENLCAEIFDRAGGTWVVRKDAL
jgi:DNA modification methylase